MSNKIVGFYGGKFIPFHKGHKYCIEKALEQCDVVHVILFDSPENRHLEHGTKIDDLLTIEARIKMLEDFRHEILSKQPKFKELLLHYINTNECVKEDGSEDWDKETPLVLDRCGGKFDYVYSSEPSYDEYFKRAYPFAKHILVDPPREVYPISGTQVRTMDIDEAKKWTY